MKFAAAMLLACMTLIILHGCSKEEPVNLTDKRTHVRRPIEKAPYDMETDEISETFVLNAAPETKTSGSAAPSEQKDPINAEEDTGGKKTGFYTTKKGDSLLSIAAKDEIYGDSIKWPMLYRHNRDSLSGIFKEGDLPEKELPESISLKIMTQNEIANNLQKRSGNYEVVNIISSPEMAKIAPYAVRLIDNNYPVYITRVDIEGKEWLRLRVGFFKTREESGKTGERIKSLINISDIWLTTVGDIEFGEFGGY